MKKKLFLFIFLILTFPMIVNAEKSPYCDPDNEKYSEVGCEHIKADWSECAEYYDVCDVYNDNFDSSKCYEYKSAGLCKSFEFCEEDGVLKTFQFVGYLIKIIKIIIPLLLIIIGSIDFGKAVMTADDKGIKTATTMLVTRAVAGIIIFFIPTIFHFVTSLISSFGNVKSEFLNCTTCISNTSKCAEIRKNICEGQSTTINSSTEKKCVMNADSNTCECKEIYHGAGGGSGDVGGAGRDF